jgi:hypothetical protein
MKYTCYLALFVFFSTASFEATARQENNKTVKKDNKTKKQKEVVEERVEEISTDRAATRTDESDSSDRSPLPVVTFDTSRIPDDELTRGIKLLLAEVNAIEMGKSMARAALDNLPDRNAADPRMQEFFKRFEAVIAGDTYIGLYQNILIRVYRKNFTRDEINEILEFYRSPVGKKALKVLPAVMQESMQEGSKLGQYLAAKVFYDMEQEKK